MDKNMDKNLDDLFSLLKISDHPEQNIEKNDELNEKYERSENKKWIKIIPLNDITDFNKYDKKEFFILVSEVILDTENKRKTLIKFIPKISVQDFNSKTEWLYLFTINNKIVKIGGTRVGLKGRTSSYLCGHHVRERGKSGDCSKTNGFVYNTFEFYLRQGYEIKMYGYKLPETKTEVKIFEKDFKVITQSYHIYESVFLDSFKKKYEEYPVLNNNSDPKYKN